MTTQSEEVRDILTKSKPIALYLYFECQYNWSKINDITLLNPRQVSRLRSYNGHNWNPQISTVRHCYEKLLKELDTIEPGRKGFKAYLKRTGITEE